jgi:hypothetical protein
MKVAFFIDSPSIGGGYYSMLNFVSLIKKIESEKHTFIFITRNKLIFEFLNKNKINSYFFQSNILEKIILKLSTNNLIGKFFDIIKYHNPFYRYLKKNKVGYIIFNEPSSFIFYCKKINFVSYIFNTEIDQVSHFKEFQNGIYEKQKKIIEFSVIFAKKIFVFTESNRTDLVKRYNCDSSKIIIQNLIPYLPEIHKKNIDFDYEKIFRTKFKFSKYEKFIFYPAQFLEHKNHQLILDTIKYFKKNNINNVRFIFSGTTTVTKRGCISRIKAIIEKEKLSSYIIFLGNISELELIAIYKYCNYLIMPTYLGRCSLPFLESLYFGKKIFYNKYILDEKFLKYIIKIDPKNSEDCFLKIKKFLLNKNIKEVNLPNLRSVYEIECDKRIFLNNFQNLLKNI